MLIVVIFTILTLAGILCATMLNINLIPRLDIPTITVQTIYPGAGASEVETSVTKPIEDALSTLENLKKMSSTSSEGYSLIIISLNDGADANLAVQDAIRKVSAIKLNLPAEILEPSIGKIMPDDAPILNIASSSSLAPTEFFKLVEDRIQPRIASIPGVGMVDITGGTEREIKVNVNAEKLKAYNMSILQVVQAIHTSNMELPAGNVENADATYSVRLVAKYSSLDELMNTVITNTANGGKVKVLDVAEIEDGIAEQKLINRIDGQNAIGLAVQKQTDANAVRVADMVKEELASIEKEYAQDNVIFDIATDDSIFTKASTHAVIVDLILAVLIVALVCFVFLHDVRSALIVMIAVPLSIIPAFIVMYVLGYSLNLMSLMALSLVVGILVDDSIVVIENMFRHMEMGKTKWKAAIDGCKQIMFTCMAITLVIVVVFLPLAVSGGLIGNMLKEFAVPIIVATMCSLLVSFTVTPLLVSRFGKLPDENRKTLVGHFSRFVEKTFESLKNWYTAILAYSLRHKTAVLLSVVVLFIASIALLPAGFIGVAFIPDSDKGEFNIVMEMNPQVTVYQNNQISMQAEKIIEKSPIVERVFTNVGMQGRRQKNNATTITVKLVDKKLREQGVNEYAQEMKNKIMEEIPGVRVTASISSISGQTSEPIQLIVQGTDLENVREAANKVMDIVRKTPGTTDVKFSVDDPRQEVNVKLNREKIASMNLSVSDIGSTLRTALTGNDDSKFRDGIYEYDIRIGVDNFDRSNPEDVGQLTVLNRKGELIELKEIATITYALGPSALERTNRISSITVKSNIVGRPSGSVGNEIMAGISQSELPDGVVVKPTGTMEETGSSFGILFTAFLIAIVLIYLIMTALYNSLLDPLIVLFSIPPSLIGAFLALALTMNNLTIFSMVGLIVLIGLVAKDAILLVDFTNQIRAEKGMSIFDSLIEAGKERLRPILMTTFAMTFGMLPIALASGNGAEIKNGMAWVIIGGLTSSMLLTLVVVPLVYYLIHTAMAKYRSFQRRRLVRRVEQKLAGAVGE